MVAGRAPLPLSDQDIHDLLLSSATDEVKDADSDMTLNDDAKPSNKAGCGSDLKFMSREQLLEAHARLKACYDEKLLEARQKIADGGEEKRSRDEFMSLMR